MAIISEDIAPFVRVIVRYDQKLAEERMRRSGMLSGGGRGKRMRMTRTAMASLEGGQRTLVRREKWFEGDVVPKYVEDSAGQGWSEAMDRAVEQRREEMETARRGKDEDMLHN